MLNLDTLEGSNGRGNEKYKETHRLLAIKKRGLCSDAFRTKRTSGSHFEGSASVLGL